MATANSKDDEVGVISLPGFVPLRSLWQGESPMYPSEHAARWALRRNEAEFLKARALALCRGKVYVHRERFTATAEQVAVSDYARRHGHES